MHEIPNVLLFIEVLLMVFILAVQSAYWQCVYVIAYGLVGAVLATMFVGLPFFWAGILVPYALLLVVMSARRYLVNRYGIDESVSETKEDAV